MSRVRIIQSFRRKNVPTWIARCLKSVEAWAAQSGYDYHFVGDEGFDLCGPKYLERAKGNLRTITNLMRLELVKRAFDQGYELACWVDADIQVFAPQRFYIEGAPRYAFARETWLAINRDNCWQAHSAVNNSVFVCRAGEPDLDFLIAATRHVAMHRELRDNYQVGGDLIKGLRNPLGFDTLSNVGMLSNYVLLALARGGEALLQGQARMHGAPIYAANLCASSAYAPQPSEAETMAAMDALETSRGDIINRWLDGSEPLPTGRVALLEDPDLVRLLA